MNRFERVREICGGWGLYEEGNSTEQMQLLKALSEVGELADSILENDREQAKDDIGDILVCFINAHYISSSDPIPSIDRIPGIDRLRMPEDCIMFLLCQISNGIRGVTWMMESVISSLKWLAFSFGLTLEECLDQAISVIEKRKGNIKGGVFIKDAN